MEKADVTMVHQNEQESFAPRRRDHVPGWTVVLGRETLVTRWTRPLRHQIRPQGSVRRHGGRPGPPPGNPTRNETEPAEMAGLQNARSPPLLDQAGAMKTVQIPDNFFSRRCIMNWDQIAGDWKQLKGKVKEKWGKLTDDDLTTIAGKREHLAGVLQERYGYAKDQAEKELNEFSDKLKL